MSTMVCLAGMPGGRRYMTKPELYRNEKVKAVSPRTNIIRP